MRRFQRVEHRVRMRAPGVAGTLPRHLCQLWRHTRRDGAFRGLAALPAHLQQAYGLGRLRDLPAALGGKVIRQVRRAVGRTLLTMATSAGVARPTWLKPAAHTRIP